jgi:hypothetical protein
MSNEMNEYKLRKATNEDLRLSFEIRKNALGKYVEQTWGWDEEWQWEYHRKDFDIFITQVIESNGEAVGTLELAEDDGAVKISGIYIIDTFSLEALEVKL